MKKSFSFLVIGLLVLTVGLLVSRSFRVSEIPNGSVNSCANCHINPAGGGARNDFGSEVESNFLDAPGAAGSVEWGPDLAALDSDGDGFTNGEELLDPDGTWTKGDPAPGNRDFVTNPGDANDFPSPIIIVSTPNGGENFEPDQQVEITWQSNVVSNVMIELSTDNGGSWSEITASTESNGSFTWTVPDVFSEENKIRINDLDSEASDESDNTFAIFDPTGIEDELKIDFALKQNYPNPFNPATTIEFNIPRRSSVDLKVFNSNGELVKTILNESISSGTHRVNWNGKNQFGEKVASGVYIYRLTAGEFVSSKQMVLIK